MGESLQNKTIKNAFWSFLGRFGALIIGFIGNLILARLLSVDDFGCFGILTIFTCIADILVNSGFGSALIQKKEITPVDCSTVFFFNLILSVILFIILFILSPFIANYFNIPILSAVLKVESLAIIIRALYIIPISLIQKNLNLKSVAIINTIAMIISVSIAIIFAYKGLGIWSLVIKNLGLQVVLCVLYWIYSKYKIYFSFSFDSFKQLFSYGGFLTVASLLESIFSNVSTFIMGKKFNVQSVGYYSQADSLGQIPIYSLSSIAIQTLFPTLSLIQDDEERLRLGISKAIQTMAFISFPLILLLIVLSKPIILFFYTEKWINSVPFLQLICIRGFVNSHMHINITVLKSVGRSKIVMYFQLLIGIIRISLMLLGIRYGIIGFLWGDVIGAYIGWMLLCILNGKINHYGLKLQIKDMIPSLILSLSVFILFYYLNSIITLSYLLQILIISISFLFVYIVLALIFRIKGVEIISRIKEIFK